jgi:hypothetical protein
VGWNGFCATGGLTSKCAVVCCARGTPSRDATSTARGRAALVSESPTTSDRTLVLKSNSFVLSFVCCWYENTNLEESVYATLAIAINPNSNGHCDEYVAEDPVRPLCPIDAEAFWFHTAPCGSAWVGCSLFCSNLVRFKN